MPCRGRGYGIRRRFAVLQRLRARAGAFEPVHGCRGDLRVASPQRRPPSIFEDGQQSRDFIHVSDIVDGHRPRARLRRRRRARDQPRHGARRHGRRGRRGARRGLGVEIEPECRGSIALATSGTASPTRRAPRSCWVPSRCRSRTGMSDLVDGSRARTAVDRVDDATESS